MPRPIVFCLILAVLLLPAPRPGHAGGAPFVDDEPLEKIVNGVLTSEYPSTVALLNEVDGVQFCTGTLVGCNTVLTAAHCVCEEDGAACQGASSALLDPGEVVVFSQHGGFAGVASITVPANYEFGTESDVAVLELSSPVDGVAPSPINTIQRPAPGTSGTIVGFGLAGSADADDAGLKRRGRVSTAACTAVPDEAHVCWNFAEPQGQPGNNSNTCVGDSGGPLFVDFGAGPVVAGVTSGGLAGDCLPPDQAWDADVSRERAWIAATAGTDLDATSCGDLPQAGEADTAISARQGVMDAGNSQRSFTISVPPGAKKLRVALNAEEGTPGAPTDFDLYLRAAVPATTTNFDCASQIVGSYEFCDIDEPRAGNWYILVDRFIGVGRFQVTATVFGGEAPPAEGCVPSATALCIDDREGDRRFEIAVDFATDENSGQGQGIPLAPLDIKNGGLFWFFDITNPEILIKVLNGCAINGNYWVFWSAGTTVGLDLRVTDTATGRTVTYFNDNGRPAAPVSDLEAFSCDAAGAGRPAAPQGEENS